jgi:6-hydroxynicotinate 3-monooxygenase
MSSKPTIAIIGGGLGGLTAAILLQRAGYNPAVYEQAPEIARIGAGINLWPNSTRILKALGFEKELQSIGTTPENWLNCEWDTGRVYFRQPAHEWNIKYGAPHLILHRGDLQSFMLHTLEPGTVRYSKSLVDLHEKANSIEMVFRDGTTAEADIVIGADGINSVVREKLLGPEPPKYTGNVAYRAVFPSALLGDYKLRSDSGKYWSDERHPALEDRHFIFYYLTSAKDEIYFVTGSPDPNWKGGANPVDVDIAEIKECYVGFHEDVQRIIDACPKASKWPMLIRDPLPLWSRGRIVMLGDACHPMKPHMGQGAGMAIEDAVILVRCIDAAAGDYAGAFELYKANRIDRASKVQKISNINIWLRYPTDPTWCFAYDAMTVPLYTPSGSIFAARSLAELDLVH